MQRHLVVLACISSFAVSVGAASVSHGGGLWGRFVGTVMTEWDIDGRTMHLLDDFGYVDTAGNVWKALKGHKIDGASIPQVFWSFIGGPFEGKYRNASVVHDFECDVKKRPWRSVHRMFYAASRCGGVEQTKAKVMFAAVYHFGPRWGAGEGQRAFRTDEDFKRIRNYVESNPDVTLEEIESLDQAALRDFERRKHR
jgi:hypothetical protein